jgi:hypothetical protein
MKLVVGLTFATSSKMPYEATMTFDRMGIYGGVISGCTNNDAVSATSRLSPEYTDAEIKKVWDEIPFREKLRLSKVLDLTSVSELKCR